MVILDGRSYILGLSFFLNFKTNLILIFSNTIEVVAWDYFVTLILNNGQQFTLKQEDLILSISI